MAISRKQLWVSCILIVLAGMGFYFYHVSIRPVIEYWKLSINVQDDLRSFYQKRPMNVEAKQWEDAVGWTSTLLGNVGMMTNECDLPFLQKFHLSLKKKTERGVDLDTLKWMWDELAKAGPRAANYAYKYRPVLLMVSEPITDEMLLTLWGIEDCRVLNLRGANISDQGLVHLKHLSKMEIIYLTGTNVTPEGVAELQNALRDCKIVHEDL